MLPLVEDNALFVASAIFIRATEALGAASYLTVIFSLVPSYFPGKIFN